MNDNGVKYLVVGGYAVAAWTNPGIVTTKARVFGQVGAKIVALDQATGKLVWGHTLESQERANSNAATGKHLFVSLRERLIALELSTGKEAWKGETPDGGTLSIGDKMVFLAIGARDGGARHGGLLLAFATDPDAMAETDGK